MLSMKGEAFDNGLLVLEQAYIAQGWRIVQRDFMKVGDREFVKYRILDPERNLEATMATAAWIIRDGIQTATVDVQVAPGVCGGHLNPSESESASGGGHLNPPENGSGIQVATSHAGDQLKGDLEHCPTCRGEPDYYDNTAGQGWCWQHGPGLEPVSPSTLPRKRPDTALSK